MPGGGFMLDALRTSMRQNLFYNPFFEMLFKWGMLDYTDRVKDYIWLTNWEIHYCSSDKYEDK